MASPTWAARGRPPLPWASRGRPQLAAPAQARLPGPGIIATLIGARPALRSDRAPALSLALGLLCSTARSRCRSLVYRHVCLLLACSAPQSLLCSQVSGTIATFIGARPALAAALRHHRYDRWRSACAALLRSRRAGALRHHRYVRWRSACCVLAGALRYHRYVRWLLAGSGLRSDRGVALRHHRYAHWRSACCALRSDRAAVRHRRWRSAGSALRTGHAVALWFHRYVR
jgi:hypothetical protein